jgi:CRP-like cAMP-binding protein
LYRVVSAEELAGVPLFASLSDAQRQDLASEFRINTAEAGSRLIGEGAASYSFFVLAEGTAVVTSQGSTISELGPGDYFGEIAILERRRRTATVAATSHVKLLVMYAAELRRLEASYPDIAAQIEQTTHERLS